VLHEDSIQTGDEQDDQHHDVEVRGAGECCATLLDATQVDDSHQKHANKTERHRVFGVEASCGANCEDASGDADGDREDVVDQQRCPGNQRRHLAEVLAADHIRAATGRVGVDRLAIAHHHDHHQDADDDRNRDEVPERRRANAGLQQQDHQDFVGCVCRRRDRVGGEDRQGDQFAQPLMLLFLRRHRLADEEFL